MRAQFKPIQATQMSYLLQQVKAFNFIAQIKEFNFLT